MLRARASFCGPHANEFFKHSLACHKSFFFNVIHSLVCTADIFKGCIEMQEASASYLRRLGIVVEETEDLEATIDILRRYNCHFSCL